MNETLQMIHARRSVRQYTHTPISSEQQQAIIAAALRAPTAGNMMLYTIIVVEDQALKDRLAVTCDDQPFIAKAPLVLLFVADYQRWMDLYAAAGAPERALELGLTPRSPTEGDLMLACMDAIIAAQTAVLAAEALGIGSCYIGDVIENWEQHQALFDLPRYTFPAALVCFGRPTPEQLGDPRPRFDQRFIVQHDRYQRFSAEELNDVHLPFGMHSFDERPYPNGARNVVQLNYTRKFVAPFSLEMTRSVRAILENWRE